MFPSDDDQRIERALRSLLGDRARSARPDAGTAEESASTGVMPPDRHSSEVGLLHRTTAR